MCIKSHAPSTKRQITVTFTCHFRIVSSQREASSHLRGAWNLEWFLNSWKNCGPFLDCVCFRRFSRSREKRLVSSSYQSVPPYLSARLPLDENSWNLILRIFVKIPLQTPDLVTIEQIFRAFQREVHLTTFNFCRRHKFAVEAFFFNTQYFYVYGSDM